MVMNDEHDGNGDEIDNDIDDDVGTDSPVVAPHDGLPHPLGQPGAEDPPGPALCWAGGEGPTQLVLGAEAAVVSGGGEAPEVGQAGVPVAGAEWDGGTEEGTVEKESHVTLKCLYTFITETSYQLVTNKPVAAVEHFNDLFI